MRFETQSEESLIWFDTLIRPITRVKFFERYFEREALHVLAQPDGFESPLSNQERDRLVLGDPGLAKRVEAVLSGRNIEVLKSDLDDDIADGAIAEALARGATVRLLGIQSALLGVKLWTERLVGEFGGTSNANAYLTPAHTPGVAAHYDTHDVLVYQVSGTKHWSVFVPLPDHHPFLPLPSETARMLDTSMFEKRSFTLRGGDFLYIPRGAAHATVGGTEYSVHLTLAIQPVRWRDLILDELLSIAEDDHFFRRAVRNDSVAEFERHRNALINRLLARTSA